MVIASAGSQYNRIRVKAVERLFTSTDTETKKKPHQTPVSFETAPMACLERGLFRVSVIRFKALVLQRIYLSCLLYICRQGARN